MERKIMKLTTLSVALATVAFASSAFAQTSAQGSGKSTSGSPGNPMMPGSMGPVTPKSGKAFLTLKGSGPLGYECKNTDGKFAWAGPVPNAKLSDKGKDVGKYVAGPTWELADGSKVTGKQVATSPGAAGSIPLQLVDASGGTGQFAGVTNIQRINTSGGVAPGDACGASNVGTKKDVMYSADYVFFK